MGTPTWGCQVVVVLAPLAHQHSQCTDYCDGHAAMKYIIVMESLTSHPSPYLFHV
jgi:hypothetical protein